MNYSNNPYMNAYMNPQMNFNNPYMVQPMQQARPVPNQQPVAQPTPQPVPQYTQIGLQGKSVDSIDVVKATDIPLDGSVSYFPIMDGSAIITKQLQADGTSKITVYKPVNEEDQKIELPKYITQEQFDEKIKSINENNPDYKEDIKKINRQIEDLTDDIANINKNLKKRKDD